MIKSYTVKLGVKPVRKRSENRLKDSKSLKSVKSSANTEKISWPAPILYIVVLEGSGQVYTDGSVTEISQGSVFRLSPSVVRKIRAKDDGLKFICIQCKENSLSQYTFSDGAIDEGIDW